MTISQWWWRLSYQDFNISISDTNLAWPTFGRRSIFSGSYSSVPPTKTQISWHLMNFSAILSQWVAGKVNKTHEDLKKKWKGKHERHSKYDVIKLICNTLSWVHWAYANSVDCVIVFNERKTICQANTVSISVYS